MKETISRNGSWLYLFVFVVFVNLFFFSSFGALAGALLMGAICLLVISMFARQGNGLFVRSAVLMTGILALMTLFVSSPEKYGLITTTFIGTMIVMGYSMLKLGPISGILELMLSPLMMGLGYLGGGIRLLFEMMSGNFKTVFGVSDKESGKSPWIKSTVIGTVLGIPLVIWLTSTLSQADPIFASYASKLINQDLWNDWMPRAIFSFVVLVLTAPLVFMRLSKYSSPMTYIRKADWSREVVVITVMIVVVLTAFLVIQWPYVFATVAKETDLSKYGVATYSAYVQKGFWDLLKVTLMVYGVAWAGLLFGRSSKGFTLKFHYALQTILGLEFALFIASIFRRVWLYQSYHGLSLARLYGLVLLIWIMGMMLTMVMRYIYPRIAWVRVEMGWILLVILTTTLVNLEGLVVKYPPTVNNLVDYVYLSRLPGDGYDGWVKAYKWAQQTQLSATSVSGVISREKRREVYYALLISNKLANNYHKLIMQYGSDEEVKEYFGLVLNAKLSDLDLNAMSDNEKNSTMKMLKTALANLETKEWADKINIDPSHNYLVYSNFSRAIEDGADNSFYMISVAKENERLGQKDKMLAWSMADAKNYQKMKEDIGVGAILQLQRQSMVITQMIAKQPKDERDFDIDIAL